MEIKQLRLFLALSQRENMTQTARDLYVSQQALSKAIRRFENDLGVSLFVRNPHGIVLTDYGKRLLPFAKKAVEDVDAALGALAEMKHGKRAIQMGYVVGSFSSFSALPPSIISDWEKANPEYSVFVQERNPDELAQMLMEEVLDIAYVVGADPGEMAGISSRLLTTESLGMLMAEEHGGAWESRVGFADIESIPVLLGKVGSIPEEQIRFAFKNAGYVPTIRYYNGPFSQCVERVRLGEGILVAGRSYCLSVKSKGLVVRPFPDCSQTITHVLCHKKGRNIADSVRNMMVHLERYHIALDKQGQAE